MLLNDFLLKCRGIQTLSRAEVDVHIDCLTEKVKSIFKPDVVVSVADGGLYAGMRIAATLGCEHLSVKAGRTKIAGAQPAMLSEILILVLESLTFSFRNPQLVAGIAPEDFERLRAKKVLLVDDVVASGKTVDLVSQYLHSLGVSTIFVAALTDNKDVADVSILKGRYCYPWSRLSPEYANFNRMHIVPHACS